MVPVNIPYHASFSLKKALNWCLKSEISESKSDLASFVGIPQRFFSRLQTVGNFFPVENQNFLQMRRIASHQLS